MGVLANIKQGKPSFGLNLALTDPVVLEYAKLAGYDFVRLDCEHILYDYSTLGEMLRLGRALNIDVQLRLADPAQAGPLLDMGATALMFPHVSSALEAKRIVELTKFPPLGDRGLTGASRVVQLSGLTASAYQAQANTKVYNIIQIESKEALERIDEILSVPGIDLVATGRNDLSQSLGVPGQKNHPKVLDAENTIIRKTLDYGKTPTILCKSQKRYAELLEQGVRCFSVGRDDSLLKTALETQLQKFTQPCQE